MSTPQKIHVIRGIITVVLGISIGLMGAIFFLAADRLNQLTPTTLIPIWDVRSIDTMKFSRDFASEMMDNQEFDQTINRQVQAIAKTGASHVSIATPYDEKFIPYLSRWVKIAREYGLHIWFRGNFAGWEGWFNYDRISREDHLRLLKSFLNTHADLFADGDIFTPCPECENGGPGDPRKTGDVVAYRKFLIDEYRESQTIFAIHGKRVAVGYNSMNYDVANLVMDPDTTKALGGVVGIDHYVSTPQKLNSDITKLALKSEGKIILGETGFPIPDIHGNATDTDQANWIETTNALLGNNPNLIGMNYWVNEGGSTALWNDDGSAKPAVSVLSKYYHMKRLQGIVYSTTHKPIANAKIQSATETILSDASGQFNIVIHPTDTTITITAPGYPTTTINISNNMQAQNLILTEGYLSPAYKIIDYIDHLYLSLF